MNNKVTFKPYDMNQLKLPIDLGIDIPENHLVKIVNRAIEWMDLLLIMIVLKKRGSVSPKTLWNTKFSVCTLFDKSIV